jgi:FkbM family methyltransferase
MLWRALKNIKNGFYIDIGACDPVLESVSKLFYDNGWRGINVEPDIYYYEKLKIHRSDEIILNLAVSDSIKKIKFYQFEKRGLSTCNLDVVKMHLLEGLTKPIEKEIPTISMDSLLEKSYGKDIQWLKIDVEGYEKNILQSWKNSKIRPWIILIESTIPNSQKENFKEWESIILNKGYEFIYFDGLNRFYLSVDYLNLKKFFASPPNVFDNFSLYKNVIAESKAQQAESKAQQAESKAQQAELKAQQAESKAQQAESKAQQAESKAQQAEATLQNIYCSRSWRITSSLRRLSFQLHLLQSLGFVKRSKALGSKIFHLISKITKLVRQIYFENGKYLSQFDLTKPSLVLDMRVIGENFKTGVYRVVDELFPRLAKSEKFNVQYFMQGCSEVMAAKYFKAHDIQGAKVYSVGSNSFKYCDIFLSPFHEVPKGLTTNRKIHHAHIIHDLIAISHPEYFTQESVTEVRDILSSLNKNTMIIVCSEFTKKDLLSYRPDLAFNQIVTIPLAAGENFSPYQSAEKKSVVRKRYGIPSIVPYILSLATLEIRKNLDKVVESYRLYMSKHPESQLYLVLAGMKGWKLDKLNKALTTAGSISNRIILTGFIEDEHLPALYSDALCFIYLSKYEGFGLPPLESMACGTPVICSNNSSLPEVVGSGGIIIDADDVNSAATKIHKIMTNENYRAELVINGLKRAEKFSWDNSANILTAALLEFWNEKQK